MRKIFAICISACLSLAIRANTYTVTSTVDHPITGAGISVNSATGVITGGTGNGLVTVRSAIAAANSVAGPHTINIPAGTFNLTIAGTGEGLSPAIIGIGDLDVTVNNVTIHGAGMNSTIIHQNTGIDRLFDVNVNFIPDFFFTMDNLTLSGGREQTGNGGGAVFTGSSNNLGTITFTNVKFDDNQAFQASGFLGTGLGGGGLQHQGGDLILTGCIFNNNSTTKSGGALSAFGFRNLPVSLPKVINNMTVTNCTFTNNSSSSGASGGGAIDFFALNLSQSVVSVTGCTFSDNSTGSSVGGAISNESTGLTVTKSTFLNNHAATFGGAMYVAGGEGTTINYCRIVNNTAPSGGSALSGAAGFTYNADDNWFGINNPASLLHSGATANTWLQLKTTANPTTICNTTAGLGNTSNITTSFLTNSAGTSISLANLVTVLGLPVTWSSTLGSLSGQQATIQSNGNATALFTSNGTGGNATVNTQVDNVPANDVVARATIIVHTIPIVTDPTNFTSCVGGTASFSSTITGIPAPTIQWRKGTTVLINGLQASGSTVSGQGTATLTITNVQTGDELANYNVRAFNECGEDISANASLIVNSVTGGAVGSDQTICSGGDPAAFTESVASTGDGVLTYQWQSSTGGCGGSFSNIGGATSTTYDPPSGLTQTTTYRRVTTSTLNAVPCTALSNCITVTVNSVTGGTVATNQTVCSGGDPASFTQSVASTGSGALTYQWQSSTTGCGGVFSDIGGATATTYDPPAGLLVTTNYRRVTTSTLTGVPCTALSNCVTVNVNDVTGGTITADQTVCSGGDPALLTQSVASTGSGALTYQWQSSTTGCDGTFSNIGGATSTTYDPPTGLLVTTNYRRVTTSTLNAVPCTAISNCVTVTINNVTGGTVGSDQAICSGGDPALFTESVASTGSGALTYQWQSSTTGCGGTFSNIPGATSATYDAPGPVMVTTNYRRVTTSTLNGVPCTANSNCITVTARITTGGTVAASQTICSGGDPAAFTESVASTGDGVLTYQWQSSTTDCSTGFSDIGGATATTYDPPAGLTVTTYYRRVTTATFNGLACTANGNCLTVTIAATPNITCPTNTSTPACQTQTAVNNAFTAWLATASGSGGVGGILTNNNTGAPPACGGSTTVTFTYTNTCSPLTTTCQATFTVTAPDPVVLTCAVNTSTPGGQTQAAVNAAFAAWLATASGTGGCNGVLTNNNSGAPPAGGGSTTVTFTYTSSCAPLTTTCQATFTVLPPCQINCPPNVVVDAAAGSCGAIATWSAPTTTGDCGTLTLNHQSGDFFSVGTTTVTVTSTSTGQTCQFTVTVNDKQPPTITCPGTQTVTLGAACAGNLGDYTALATTSDNCPATVTVTQNPAINAPVSGVGSLTVTLKATDGAGNTATCSFTVNKVDNTNPAITCPGTQTLNVGPTCTASLPDYTSLATATDNCGTPNVTQSPAPSTTEGPGSILVTLTATDGSNNTSQCTFTVNVIDNTPPTFSCPSNITANTDANQCYATVSITTPTASDNCGTPTVSGTRNDAQPLNAVYPSGITTIHWVATDGAGKTATCNQTVTVSDKQGPSLQCPADRNLNLNPGGACNAMLPDYRSLATVSDNCSPTSGITLTQSPTPSTSVFGTGTMTVTLTATDQAGNTSSCSFVVTKVDVNAPHIECPANQTLNVGASCTAALGDYRSMATITDNCTPLGSIVVTQSPAPGTIEGPGPVTVTITATDASNNTNDCSFTVTVQDKTPPTVTCPGTQTLALGSSCSASLPDYRSLAIVSDNCTSSSSIIVTQSPAQGTTQTGIGTLTVTLTAMDASGNTATCNFTLNKVDNTPPQVSCPANITQDATSGCAKVVTYIASATDNCGLASFVASPPSGSSFPVGVTTVTATATDNSGNTATCSFTVTVRDVTPPTFSANLTANPVVLWPPDHKLKDITLSYATTDNCGGSASVTNTILVTSTDPISGVTDGDKFPDWVVINDHLVQLRAERGGGKDARVYTIRVLATDASGNTAMSQPVEVRIAHNITSPNSGAPFLVGSTVNFNGVFWDKPGNKHTAQWLIDDNTVVKGIVTEPSGTKNGKVTGSYKFTSTGVYRLQMNVTDQNRITSYCNTNEDLEEIVVIYDPNGGYTYGGGWLNSPPGALTSDPSATGKVSYGFSVNYYKGATLPKGETQFEFKVGDLQYNALNFEYLSVGQYKAVFKGAGKIIGGQSGINFIMYVTDGALDGTGVDKVRVKIFNKNTGYVYYDNEPTASDADDPKTVVGINSSVIIQGTPLLTTQQINRQALDEMNIFDVRAIPNPSNQHFNLKVMSGDKQNKIKMQVVDMYGRIMEVRTVSANQTIQLGDNYRPGTYIVKFIQGENHRELKLLKMPN